MKLYLVRHGQSMGNLNGIHQDKNTPLSENGKKQANELARRFKTIPIDIILSSHFRRACDTAKAIANETKKPLELSELLREIKMPSEIEGKSTTDPSATSIITLRKENIHNPAWHYSDEENIFDLIARAQTFLKLLEKRKETNILVVSHGRFIQAVGETILLGKLLTTHIFEELKDTMHLSNTGITVFEKINTKWHLVTWNDSAHLGSI